MDNDHSAQPQPTHSDHVERLSQAVTREWLYDGQIVVYTLADVRRESVDTRVNAFQADMGVWPADRLFRVMHDFSTPGAVATPYSRARAQEIIDLRPEIRARVAVILSGTVFNRLIHLFLNRQRSSTTRIRRTFMSREQAIAWLSRED